MSFITSGGGSGGISGPITSVTDSIALFADTTGQTLKQALHLTVTDGGDRAKITTGAAGVMEIHRDVVGATNYLYLANRQISPIGQNLNFEENLGFGDIQWTTHDESEVGRNRLDGTYGAPKTYWVGTDIKFDKNGDGTPQSTITGLSTSILDLRSNGHILYSLNGTYYVETYTDFVGLHLLQTNLDVRMNATAASGGPGRLIFADANGAPNGPRCFSVTLTGTTTTVTNATVDTNTVAHLDVRTSVNPGFLSHQPSAGSLVITSTNASDNSVVMVTLIQNG